MLLAKDIICHETLQRQKLWVVTMLENTDNHSVWKSLKKSHYATFYFLEMRHFLESSNSVFAFSWIWKDLKEFETWKAIHILSSFIDSVWGLVPFYSITSSTWVARVMWETFTLLKAWSSQPCICLPCCLKVQIIWVRPISSLCRPSPIQYKINNKTTLSKWYLPPT